MFHVSLNFCVFHIFAQCLSTEEELGIFSSHLACTEGRARKFSKSQSIYNDSHFSIKKDSVPSPQVYIEQRARNFSKSQRTYDDSHLTSFDVSPTAFL